MGKRGGDSPWDFPFEHHVDRIHVVEPRGVGEDELPSLAEQSLHTDS